MMSDLSEASPDLGANLEFALSNPNWELIDGRGREPASVITRWLPYFVMPDLAVLDLGCGGGEAEAVVAARSYVGLDRAPKDRTVGYLDLDLDDIPDAHLDQAEVVIASRLFEHLENPKAVLDQLAARGLPVFATYWVSDFVPAGRPAPAEWKREYSLASFAELAASAGYEIVFQQLVHFVLMAAFLAPVDHSRMPRPWRTAEAKKFVKRRQKKGDRYMERMSDIVSGKARQASDRWSARSAFAARLVPEGLALLDVGCLGMYLEASAKPRIYIPVDIVADDPRTRRIDLNERLLPREWVEEAELVACLGVYEYLKDPAANIAVIAAAKRPMLLSYNVAEARKKDGNGLASNWASALTTAEIDALLEEHRFDVVRRVPFGPRQMVWLALPRDVAVRPAWWDDLPPPPANAPLAEAE
ncbi:methyltransferase domain-containing protein [Methylopila sp. Yamaguchi]|uniref:methyltransferase domain-containing protein n=1 Tax=Methylopila sp. Yamaguchi TaxID=1437817 RepID=UPI000CC6CA64|nr:methyltransferase domain-containing protein [Methylopila sp. Yamaguchi]GBD50869.1 hypothetical protein METY_4082 [Methylopila sp. Yamaguchi]